MNKTKLYKLAKLVMSFKEYDTEAGKLIVDGELIEGVEVNTLDENGEVITAPDGTYELDGKKVTIEGGVITLIEEIKEEEEPVEETPVEEPTEEPVEEEQPKEEETTEEQPVEEPAVNPELEEAKRIIEEKDAKIAELEARIAELEAELAKPVEEPLEMKSVAQETKSNKSGVMKYFED